MDYVGKNIGQLKRLTLEELYNRLHELYRVERTIEAEKTFIQSMLLEKGGKG